MKNHTNEVSTYKKESGGWIDCCDDCKKAGEAAGTEFLGVADLGDECEFCDARNLPTRQDLFNQANGRYPEGYMFNTCK